MKRQKRAGKTSTGRSSKEKDAHKRSRKTAKVSKLYSKQSTKRPGAKKKRLSKAYSTKLGEMFIGKIEDALAAPLLSRLEGKVNLILTSPPFPLVTKKKYGNETGQAYLEWLKALAPKLARLLTKNGSIVIEIGNAWVPGAPVMSTLPLEALLAFKTAAKLQLCQHAICHNSARLPSPAEWVTIRRIRLKDSFTHIWWMSRSKFPKASNSKVLTPYGKAMKTLLANKTYNAGRRPSGHVISEEGFLKDHGGAISANVIDLSPEDQRLPTSLLKFSNTAWDATYRKYCVSKGLEPHPARMQMELAAFFTEFLTDPGDLVLDPFAGSNTTGFVAEALGRKWIAIEAQAHYAKGSKARFQP